MDKKQKELLSKIWILLMLSSGMVFVFSMLLIGATSSNYFSYFLIIFAAVSFLGIPVSMIQGRKDRNSKNLFFMSLCVSILVIMAIIFVIFTFTCYFSGCDPPLNEYSMLVVDNYCQDGTASILVMNSGAKPLDFGTSCIIDSNVATCGGLTVTKISGNFSAAPMISSMSIETRKVTVVSEPCGKGNTCSYRLVYSGSSSYYPATASVDC